MNGKFLAQGRALGEGNRIGRPRLGAVESAIRAVNVNAAGYNYSPGNTLEYAHQILGILTSEGNHVEHYFWRKKFELFREIRKAVFISENLIDGGWEIGLRLPPVKESHLMPSLNQSTNDVRASERCSTNDENLHAKCSFYDLKEL